MYRPFVFVVFIVIILIETVPKNSGPLETWVRLRMPGLSRGALRLSDEFFVYFPHLPILGSSLDSPDLPTSMGLGFPYYGWGWLMISYSFSYGINHSSSSTEGHPPPKVVFHRRLSSTKGCLPLKVVFHQMVAFHQRLSSTNSRLLTTITLWSMYQILASYLA